MQTALCKLLGIDVPIIQAPMGGAVGPAIAAAVSNAGALGMLVLWRADWRDPAALVPRAKAANAIVLHTVGTAEAARRAVDCGVDVVVAQGWEAGGHVRGTVAPLPLVPAVVDAVSPTPVVAAGGIADGRGLAAVLALGASGAWIGTRFLASNEAAIHPRYRERL